MDHQTLNAAATDGGSLGDLGFADADYDDDDAVGDALQQAHPLMAGDQLQKCCSTVAAVVIAASPTERCVASLTRCLKMSHLDCKFDKVLGTFHQRQQHYSRMAFDTSRGDEKQCCS